jgi:hypothetical protein
MNILATEEEPSVLKHLEDIVKLKHSFNKHAVLLVYIMQLFYNVWCKKQKKILATGIYERT